MIEVYEYAIDAEEGNTLNEIPQSVAPEQIIENSKKQADKTTARKGQRGRSGSGVRRETYNTLDLGLDEGKRKALRDFYASKKPHTQNDQVLTLMFWLAKEADITEFTDDQIYSALRIVNERIPKAIGSVMRSLKGDGMLIPKGKGSYSLHHIGEDYVNLDLPREKSEGKS